MNKLIALELIHMTETDPLPADRTTTRRVSLPFAAATAFGVCCALPLLASVGVAGVIAGLGTGSWIILAVASLTTVLGVLRWRRERVCHTDPETIDAGSVATVAFGGASPDPEARR